MKIAARIVVCRIRSSSLYIRQKNRHKYKIINSTYSGFVMVFAEIIDKDLNGLCSSLPIQLILLVVLVVDEVAHRLVKFYCVFATN